MIPKHFNQHEQQTYYDTMYIYYILDRYIYVLYTYIYIQILNSNSTVVLTQLIDCTEKPMKYTTEIQLYTLLWVPTQVHESVDHL